MCLGVYSSFGNKVKLVRLRKPKISFRWSLIPKWTSVFPLWVSLNQVKAWLTVVVLVTAYALNRMCRIVSSSSCRHVGWSNLCQCTEWLFSLWSYQGSSRYLWNDSSGQANKEDLHHYGKDVRFCGDFQVSINKSMFRSMVKVVRVSSTKQENCSQSLNDRIRSMFWWSINFDRFSLIQWQCSQTSGIKRIHLCHRSILIASKNFFQMTKIIVCRQQYYLLIHMVRLVIWQKHLNFEWRSV